MTATLPADRYALDRTLEEERLQLQARGWLDRMSERFLREAGLGPGMRVLDLGSGMADHALVAARIVGPSGQVVGVERDPGTLAAARRRLEAAGAFNVELVEGDVTALEEVSGGAFDAAVGRLVLHYVDDPAAALRSAAAVVRPGGLVMASEFDFAAMTSHPHVPAWDHVAVLMFELFVRLGSHPRLGLELRRIFGEAWLPEPVRRAETEIGGAPDAVAFPIAAATLRSMAPAMEATGTATVEELGLDDLEDRLREDVLAAGAEVTTPMLCAAWARTPTRTG
jgi:SAM-dependent methyltransferase